MNTYTVSALLVAGMLSACSGQHYGPVGQQHQQPQQLQYQPQVQYQQEPYANRPPPPAILTHKQALNHDGNFKYVFTAENGLAQGESIAPDGSRNGGYTYVDPSGKKISVKYTAGKEGFRVIEGDHLPKAPQPLHPLPVVPQQQPQAYTQAGGAQYDDGQYRPELYQRPQPQYYSAGPSAAHTHTRPYLQQQAVAPTSNEINREPEYNDEPGKPHSFGAPTSNEINREPEYNDEPGKPHSFVAPTSNEINREPEYNDEPGKPHSFGNGYVFEFAG